MGTYYDIDAIMTDAQKVPCTFTLTVPGLGYMEGSPGQPIHSGTSVALPIWLAEILAVSQSLGTAPMATIDMPLCLQPRVLNALKADPRTVDLRQQAAHFYSLGARMLELFEEDDLVDVLLQTFKQRAAIISDHASNARGALSDAKGVDFMRGLDEQERCLFRIAHDSGNATRAWMVDVKKT
ncbi:hypothetical protein FH972_021486 [Carpinus fangiana]|uniref:Uncharacterized protein n=1 Tax=Carpinus fangiana TaxID=176857 RepID=A0A5N6KPF9_9ROSI|nr:hypothetical protein FH972_021486 [Carpinus fangiana]